MNFHEEFILKLQKKVMATEKIPIESLISSLVSLPGGITVYDSLGTSSKLTKPTLISELQSKKIQSVSKQDLDDQGIRIQSTNKGGRVQFVYPKAKQSLVSFVGVLPSNTLIFTNPSEDPMKHRQELTSEVFQTTADIELTNSEPTTLSVRRINDSEQVEISRLGHFISLSAQSQRKSSFPPNDLRLYLPPVHIPSQHLGDCAADTVQTALFYADGFQEEFAELANTLYKKYIRTEPLVLFGVDNPKLVKEVRVAYSLSDSLSQQEEDALAVFSTMIRRYILVRLLDFGTEEEIASLKIPPTTCLLPGAVPSLGNPLGRRKSINALAGATIARKISRIFEPSSMLGSNLKLKETEINLTMEHAFFCLLFTLLNQKTMHSMIWLRNNPISFDASSIRAILFPLMLTKKNAGMSSLEEGGHSISLFRFQDTWYLQDDNIGIANPLEQFNLEHFLTKKSEFFISSYKQLQNKSDLIEQGFFTEKELRDGKALRYTFYGYRYAHDSFLKEKILYKEPVSYSGRFDAGPAVLYLCVGDIDPVSMAAAMERCTPTSTSETKRPTKISPTVKALPPALLAQMNLPTTAAVSENRKPTNFRELRKNIQANLTSFNTTRKTNTGKPLNNFTRKLKPYTNAKILSQFTAF
jgi:hypothetical protein